MIKQLSPVFLLILANLFMTFAWYGHLKNMRDRPLLYAILTSWAIAFFEYCIQVPANRIGVESYTLPQLKIIQEIITMAVFAGFTILYMKTPVTRNYLYASICMMGAAWFIFRD